MTSKKKILITGAAGLVAGILRHHWQDRYICRLADIKPVEELHAYEEYISLDITDYKQFEEACQGMDIVLHLAADRSPAADFYKTLLDLNIIGAYNAFEAARQAGCKRLVFASSVNAVLGYQGEPTVGWEAPVFPLNVYGASKCWGEALARVYATQHGLSCINVRLGLPRFDQAGSWDPEQPNYGISERDMAQLFACCLDVAGVDHAIVPGVSRHRRAWMDHEDACRILGYQPQDGTAFPKAISQDKS